MTCRLLYVFDIISVHINVRLSQCMGDEAKRQHLDMLTKIMSLSKVM